jgi:hypothetical protein
MVIEVPTSTEGALGLMLSEVNVGLTKNPLQAAPIAAATSTPKASVKGSLFPANLRLVVISNRLE